MPMRIKEKLEVHTYYPILSGNLLDDEDFLASYAWGSQRLPKACSWRYPFPSWILIQEQMRTVRSVPTYG